MLFEWLSETTSERFNANQLRTLQRRIKRWQAERGPEKNVFLAQRHRPREAAQTDFTWTTEFAITIATQATPIMLCVFVLPYSNWQWATVSISESINALRTGIQRALFQLGHAPTFHQTDNSTAAIHRVLFVATYALVQRLLTAKRDLRLEKELASLDSFDVVILDDIGCVQQSRDEMEVLFTFLAERYGRKSVMITSNLVFSEWDRIFKDSMTPAAAIDRLVHHAVILEMTGNSLRADHAAHAKNGTPTTANLATKLAAKNGEM